LEPEEKKPAWPVFLVTLLMIPATLLSSVVVFSIAAVILVPDGVTSPAEIEDFLRSQLTTGATKTALGVLANTLVFVAVPVYLAFDRVGAEEATQRLGLNSTTIADCLLTILAMLGLTAGLDAVVRLAGLENYGAMSELNQEILALPDNIRLPLAFVVAVGAGIPEELFFRGYLMRRLAVSQGKTIALLTSALVFGLFHLDPLHAPIASVMGLLLGFVVLRTGSLYPAIVAHIANNGVAVLLAEESAAIPEQHMWLQLAAGAAFCGLCCYFLARRHRGEEHPIVW
jgi:membrane protease YdiL (CAAX protease family)